MNGIEIACSQITWKKVSAEQVLTEIAQAGYAGAPAGPWGGRTAQDAIELYARFGLKPAPGYLSADFWKPELAQQTIERAVKHAQFTRQTGCGELYVAANGFDYVVPSGKTRRDMAGHVGPGDGLKPDEYKVFAETLNRVGEATLKEGVKICFHNHVGTPIETRAELEKLLELCDEELVFLGPDTGHMAWAGDDPAAFVADYAPRIKSMHLKDIDDAIRRRGRDEGWTYDTFTKNGIFVELGEGCVDFAAILKSLRGAGFSGWLIAETDVTQKPTATESATVSRAHLRSLGL